MRLPTINVNDFAQALGVTKAEVNRLVVAGYIKRARPPFKRDAESGELSRARGWEVVQPSPAAMEWLKGCFQPVKFRPILKLKEVALMAGTKLSEIRKLCLTYGIPIHVDPVFGELLTINEFEQMMDRLHGMQENCRFDRGAFLYYLRALSTGKRARVRPPRFSERVEIEIARILRLKEPARTIRAGVFMNCYWSARGLLRCMEEYEGKSRKKLAEMDRMMRKFGKKVSGQSEGFTEAVRQPRPELGLGPGPGSNVVTMDYD